MSSIELKIFNAKNEGGVEKGFAMARTFVSWVREEEYKKLSRVEMEAILDSIGTKLNSKGELQLLVDEEEYIPFDCYIDIAYKPSYAALAFYMFAYSKYPEIFSSGRYLEWMQMLARVVLKTKLRDHGYEACTGKLDNLLLFAKVNVRAFINHYPDGCEEIAEFLKKEIYLLRNDIIKANSRGQAFKVVGFGMVTVDAKAKTILAADDGKTKLVFVYGTLMQGERAHEMIASSVYIGKGKVEGYGCYDLGTYPGIVRNIDSVCYGEVYAVSEDQLAEMDIYEGEGYLYKRAKVVVKMFDESVEAEAYVYMKTDLGEQVQGRWHNAKKVWYACYGSNLCYERFMKYINSCRDNSKPQESRTMIVKGRMYFANRSSRWNKQGVAFFDNSADGQTIMRMYKITAEQLIDIHQQEGAGDNWYNNKLFLGYANDGYPIFTLTSKNKKQHIVPSDAYYSLIKTALVEELGCSEKETCDYLQSCL